MIISNNITKEIHFQLFKHEEVLNGYYHLVQKKIHGTESRHPYVGLKNYHVKEAEKLNLPIMVHLCPNVKLKGSISEKDAALKKCNHKDQIEVMILKPENFYKFKTKNMQESKSKNENGEIRRFTISMYEVWHYQWSPDYIEGVGIIKKKPTINDLGLI